jgi:aarF domain-containing kinase
MQAFENFITAAKSGGGEDLSGDMAGLGILQSQTGYIIPGYSSSGSQPQQPLQTRAALAFLLSDKGSFFREFLLDEVLLEVTFKLKRLVLLLFKKEKEKKRKEKD